MSGLDHILAMVAGNPLTKADERARTRAGRKVANAIWS